MRRSEIAGSRGDSVLTLSVPADCFPCDCLISHSQQQGVRVPAVLRPLWCSHFAVGVDLFLFLFGHSDGFVVVPHLCFDLHFPPS